MADKPSLAFFGTYSPSEIHFFTAAWSPMFCSEPVCRPRLWNGGITHPHCVWIVEQCQILLQRCHTIAFMYSCEQSWHPSCGKLSRTPIIIQNRNQLDMSYAHDLHDLAHFLRSDNTTSKSFSIVSEYLASFVLLLPQSNGINHFFAIKDGGSHHNNQAYLWFEWCYFRHR